MKLTGEFATDCSDAAGTLLLDLRKRDWSQELLDQLEIPLKWLPTVYEGSQVTGRLLRPEIAETDRPILLASRLLQAAVTMRRRRSELGLCAVGWLAAALVPAVCIFAHSDEINLDPKGRLHTFCHAVPQQEPSDGCHAFSGKFLPLAAGYLPGRGSGLANARQAIGLCCD